MKKQICLCLAVLLLAATALTGCGSSRGLEEKMSAALGNTEAETETVEAATAESESAAAGDSDVIYAEDGYGYGEMGDVMGTYFFQFTLNDAYLATEYQGSTSPQSGYQFLVANITVENTWKDEIEMYDTDFQIQWGSGDQDFDYPVTGGDEAQGTLPEIYTLAAQEARTGELVYLVPEGCTSFDLAYLERFDDETTGDAFFVSFTLELPEGAESTETVSTKPEAGLVADGVYTNAYFGISLPIGDDWTYASTSDLVNGSGVSTIETDEEALRAMLVEQDVYFDLYTGRNDGTANVNITVTNVPNTYYQGATMEEIILADQEGIKSALEQNGMTNITLEQGTLTLMGTEQIANWIYSTDSEGIAVTQLQSGYIVGDYCICITVTSYVGADDCTQIMQGFAAYSEGSTV